MGKKREERKGRERKLDMYERGRRRKRYVRRKEKERGNWEERENWMK